MTDKTRAALGRFRALVRKRKPKLARMLIIDQLREFALLAMEAEAEPERPGAQGQSALNRMIAAAEEEETGQPGHEMAAHAVSALFSGRRDPQMATLRRIERATQARLSFVPRLEAP